MKKLILFFSVVALVMTSCKSDDDASSSDAFIGAWTWTQSFDNGVEDTLSECYKMDTWTIDSDGTFNETSNEENSNGICELDETITGSWKNLGDNVYELTTDAGTPDEETYEAEITFEGNTLTTVVTQGTYIYKNVYTKK